METGLPLVGAWQPSGPTMMSKALLVGVLPPLPLDQLGADVEGGLGGLGGGLGVGTLGGGLAVALGGGLFVGLPPELPHWSSRPAAAPLANSIVQSRIAITSSMVCDM